MDQSKKIGQTTRTKSDIISINYGYRGKRFSCFASLDLATTLGSHPLELPRSDWHCLGDEKLMLVFCNTLKN